ncbi:MAG: hypothetical protein MJ227_04505 [Bacilli bacterium]|nr:hypothetical protein [Bacilli bacterium]
MKHRFLFVLSILVSIASISSCGCFVPQKDQPDTRNYPSSISFSQNIYTLNLETPIYLQIKIGPENADRTVIQFSAPEGSQDFFTLNTTSGLITPIKPTIDPISVLVFSSVNRNVNDTCSIIIEDKDSPGIEKKKLSYTIGDYISHNAYTLSAIPNTGNPKLLVIPIWFSDSSKYITAAQKSIVLADIQTAFFGSNEETGWRSVKTYYEEESFGKVSLSGTVTDWYTCNYSSTSCKETEDTISILNDAISWYKSKHTDILSYDTNHDGYLDSVMLVYGAPDSSSSNLGNENLWAYCYWVQKKGSATNPIANSYLWASYDFMYGSNKTASSKYFGGDTTYCNLDTHTFIHETGHLFGLEDYYDYATTNAYDAAGKFSMQDHNVGAHDPFSKMALGWIKPYVPISSIDKETINIDLKALESTGDVILLSNAFSNSPFDEYLLIDLYTPTGLNEFDVHHQYSPRGRKYTTGSNVAGCRIWHIDARLMHWSVYGWTAINTTPNNKCYFACTNTSNDGKSGHASQYGPTDPKFYDYRLLQYIRSNYKKDPKCNKALSSENLFKTGDIFDMNEYGDCFTNKGVFDNGSKLGWSIKFNNVNENCASISLTRIIS